MKMVCIAVLAALTLTTDLPAEPAFKVGLVTTLSGSAADYGLSFRNSIELAKESRPDLFRKIEFIYEDAGYETKAAAAAFRKLVGVDKVNLVFTWGLSFCQALAPMAEAARVPLVALCLDAAATRGRPHVLRFFNNSDEYMQVQARYLKQRGLNKIALVAADSAFLKEMSDALERSLEAGQQIVSDERVLPTENDFRAILVKIRQSPADTIAVFLSTGQIGQFYEQARTLHISLPTFGTNWFESLSEVRSARGAMDNAVFVNTAIRPDFVDRYVRTYGNQSTLSFAGPAYELAIVLGELFGNVLSPPSTPEILNAFASIGAREGTACGPYRYLDSPTAGKYFQFPVAVKIIAGEKFETIRLTSPEDLKADVPPQLTAAELN